jgi:hypothetical protein
MITIMNVRELKMRSKTECSNLDPFGLWIMARIDFQEWKRRLFIVQS